MTVRVQTELCDRCMRCVKACIYEAVEMREGAAHILERCTSCGACLDVCKKEAIQNDAEPRTVPDFSGRRGVWVFAEQREGALNPVSLELLGKARHLAESLGQEVSAVLVGYEVSDLSGALVEHGADNVYLADHQALMDFRTLPYTAVISELVEKFRPNIFLMGASHIGRDLAPRVSRRVGSGLTADCTQLSIDPDEGILLQTRPAFGGNVMATIANRYSRPQMATVRPGVMEANPVAGRRGNVIRCDIPVLEREIGTRILEKLAGEKRQVDLANAKVVVAGGRGVGNAGGFNTLRELADVMGGEVAGTRVAVEEGWIPPENQVGQTGRSVRPEIYVACGISGAVQHRAGMVNSRYVVAINKDPRAPIFQVADWGIVGDLFEVVPEMIKQLRSQIH